MVAAENVYYIAPCPECGRPAAWTAVAGPIVGQARDLPGYRIHCPHCDRKLP